MRLAAEMKTEPGRELRGEWRIEEPMSRHTSWRAGGVAKRMYIPADLADLADCMRTLPEGEPLYFVGLGSNLLVRDGGLEGTVILTHGGLKACHIACEEASGARVTAEAGVAAPKVARAAARHDLAGAEFLAGIPGTIGGALAMNAGCYGGETWDFVKQVTTMDRHGRLFTRTPADYDVGYRHVVLRAAAGARDAGAGACFSAPGQEWFVSAQFWFPRGDGARAQRKIKRLLTRRIASQPLGTPNAGSVFRNPKGQHAARLIEACGLKDLTIGGAQVSSRHANFIVNLGHATAADIEALIDNVRAVVARNTGVELVREVRIVGKPG